MNSNIMKLRIVTPYKVIDLENVKSVNAETDLGEVEILPFHCSYLVNVEISVLTIKFLDKEKHYAVGGGALHFIEEENTLVLILNSIIPVQDIDVAKAKKKQIEAEAKLKRVSSILEHRKAEVSLRTSLLEINAKNNFKE